MTGYADQAAAELSSRGLPRLSTLLKSEAPAIASGVAGFVHSEVHKIVTGPRFARAWAQASTLDRGLLADDRPVGAASSFAAAGRKRGEALLRGGPAAGWCASR